MKQKINIFILLLGLLVVGCGISSERFEELSPTYSEQEQKLVDELVIIPLQLEYDTGQTQHTVDPEIVEKYNDIMNYIKENSSRDEDLLFEELSNHYGESPESLKEFVSVNGQLVTNDSVSHPKIDSVEVEQITRNFFADNIKGEVQGIVAKTEGINGTSQVDFTHNGQAHKGEVKMSFSVDGLKANVIQLIIDGVNVKEVSDY